MFQKLRNLALKSASGSHAGEHGDEPHVLPLSTYFAVFGALLVLTVLTVVVSVIGLPQPTAIIVAMVVAAAKATLVVLWFMHLKFDDRFYSLIFVISILFLILFFVFTSFDVMTRGQVNAEESTFSQDGMHLRQEFMKKK
ncbi:MAG: cytochrome C oxidase subunit IV family protein [Silvanigrellaceae bacterium]